MPPTLTSKLLGPPPYVLDPETLADSFNPFPGHRGRPFRQVDENTVVKYGSAVTLTEAEAMDFVSRQTSIRCPKVIGAYQLNGVTYIIMSFERGKSFESFWEDASEPERETVIGNLAQEHASRSASIRCETVAYLAGG